MSSHSIPEPQENAPSVPATPAIAPDIEISSDALALLREFFLLLDEWDRGRGSLEGGTT